MKSQADNKQQNKSQSVANSVLNHQGGDKSTFQFVDKRPEAIAQLKLQKMADTSPQVKHVAQLQSIANNNSAPQVQKKNKTGMPDKLKSGVENLSGMDMSDVNVHRNSDKPAQLNAHAYAQGTDIHVAPGQEKHLPHEAWHVVQQKQGRVQPTAQLKQKLNINDDSELEREADVMGEKASQMPVQAKKQTTIRHPNSNTAQLETKTLSESEGFDMAEESPALEGYDEMDELNQIYERQGLDASEATASPITEQALKGMREKGDGDGGKNAQIAAEGELSLTARIKGWANMESTYSKFLGKTNDFNGTTDVVKKQVLLFEIKKIARLWLTKHEEEIQKNLSSKDENDIKKLASINTFLRQTSSNYPEINKAYEEVEVKMDTFLSDPLGNRKTFEVAVNGYQEIQQLVKKYKNEYPPSLNLMYVDEVAELTNKENALIKNGVKEGSDFDSEVGLKVSKPSASFNLAVGELYFNGKLGFSISNVAEANGDVTITLNKSMDVDNIEVENGSCKLDYTGITINVENITYNHKAKKFSAELAEGSATIFDKEFGIVAEKISVENKKIDFEKITGKLPDVDFGFFKLNETQISYNKTTKELEGKTKYGFSTKQTIADTLPLSTTGDLSVHWNLEKTSDRYYEINDGTLAFKIFNQKADAKGVKYDSRNSQIGVKTVDVKLDLPGIDNTVSGENISIDKDGFNFSKISTNATGSPIEVGIFSLSPTAYSLIKKEGKYKAQVDGKVDLSLPEFLGVKSKGEVTGNVGLNLSDPSTPTYGIDTAKAEFEAENPLKKLTDLLGVKGASARYELGADFPIFPGLYAIFGVFLEFDVKVGDTIAAIIEMKGDTVEVSVVSNAFDASLKGGVFGGVKAGSELLIALALMLVAAGKIGLKGSLGYKKGFKLKDDLSDKESKGEDGGLFYNLKGDVKLEASLDIVATALYFFQKRFSLILGEKELGSFEFSDDKGPEYNKPAEKLGDRKQLDDHMEPDLKKEAEGLSVEKLFDLDYTYRFKANAKKDAIKAIEDSETERREEFEKDVNKSGDKNKFYDVALINFKRYNHFIDNRCNWKGIEEEFNKLPKIDANKQDSEQLDQVLKTIDILGKYMNIAQVFVDHYEKKITKLEKYYPKSQVIKPLLANLKKKKEMLIKVEDFKRNHLHSSYWGDLEKQKDQINTSGWFFGLGESKYEAFAKSYNEFSPAAIKASSIIEEVKNTTSTIGELMIKEHQKQTGK